MPGWIVLIVLTGSSLGLIHDVTLVSRGETGSVETGVGIETEEKFAKDFNAAPIQRKIGFAGLFILSGYCMLGLPNGVRIQSFAILGLASLLLLWTLVSILWSFEKEETAREFFRIFVYIGTGMLIARRLEMQEICLILIFSLLFSTFFAVFVDIAGGAFRPWSPDYRMHGSLHSNDLARQALILAIGAYAYALRGKNSRFWWYVFIASIAVLYYSKSRTGLLTVGCGLVCVRLIRASHQRLFVSVSLTATALALGLLLFSLSNTSVQRRFLDLLAMGRKGDLTSLTGRLPLWQEVWDQASGRSFFGFGYGAFWTVERTKEMGEELLWFPRHAHSIYLEMIVNLGFVGLSILLLLAAAMLIRTYRSFAHSHRVEYQIFFSVIIAALVNGISEAAFVLPRDQGLFNSILLFALIFSHPSKIVSLEKQLNPSNSEETYGKDSKRLVDQQKQFTLRGAP